MKIRANVVGPVICMAIMLAFLWYGLTQARRENSAHRKLLKEVMDEDRAWVVASNKLVYVDGVTLHSNPASNIISGNTIRRVKF